MSLYLVKQPIKGDINTQTPITEEMARSKTDKNTRTQSHNYAYIYRADQFYFRLFGDFGLAAAIL